MRKKLTKSTNNVVISGVLGGIAEYFNIDPTILRVVYVVLTFPSFGTSILLYIILSLIIPSGKGRGQAYYKNYHYSNEEARGQRQRKEAERVKDEEDEDNWSDF